ncbi:MAG: 2-hydroxychromene-2-carboxylate isomerase [Piscinibacter sp.]|uniref:2-hydroxychromene-2-carboxylate isomerase n=1 Tax=Piscinibacter sp. TaxID=1903157 RepID=UPI003D0BC2EE
MQIQYWFSVASPWTWLGSARFAQLVQQAGAQVQVLPMDLGAVFAASGGRPFTERPEARRSYRQLELARWSRRLGVPLTLEPRYYPVDRTPASQMLIAARHQGLDALALSHAVLRAIWSEDRNIADWATLEQIADAQGLDGAALVLSAQAPALVDELNADTQRAIAAGVFGAPTFIVEGERFWGQDRLDFLAERLGAVV